jgi:Domain of unknown function (DUF1854)
MPKNEKTPAMSTRMTPVAFELTRNPFGHLALTLDGRVVQGVVPVRAFPVQSPEQGIALMDADGHEAVWIDALSEVPQPAQGLIRDALESREFMPEIQTIVSVSSFSTPCTWSVKTDRGDTQFVLRGDEDIRRLAGQTLLVSDSHGIHFLIRDLDRLDKDSRKILDRFM